MLGVQPLALSDRYVVLTSEQWARICIAMPLRERLARPYVPAWSEGFSRHVIVQETIGM
jgi:hypothetical protein